MLETNKLDNIFGFAHCSWRNVAQAWLIWDENKCIQTPPTLGDVMLSEDDVRAFAIGQLWQKYGQEIIEHIQKGMSKDTDTTETIEGKVASMPVREIRDVRLFALSLDEQPMRLEGKVTAVPAGHIMFDHRLLASEINGLGFPDLKNALAAPIIPGMFDHLEIKKKTIDPLDIFLKGIQDACDGAVMKLINPLINAFSASFQVHKTEDEARKSEMLLPALDPTLIEQKR